MEMNEGMTLSHTHCYKKESINIENVLLSNFGIRYADLVVNDVVVK